jgi:hypothetical protein
MSWLFDSISTTMPRRKPRTLMLSRLERWTVSILVDTFQSAHLFGSMRRLWTKLCLPNPRGWYVTGPAFFGSNIYFSVIVLSLAVWTFWITNMNGSFNENYSHYYPKLFSNILQLMAVKFPVKLARDGMWLFAPHPRGPTGVAIQISSRYMCATIYVRIAIAIVLRGNWIILGG